MPDDRPRLVNGFCVSGFVCACSAAIGGLDAHILRHLPLHGVLHTVFKIFVPRGTAVLALGLILSVVGVSGCAEHPQYRGKLLGVVGIVVSVVVLAYWGALAAISFLGSLFA